jgi:hypothetical protein
MAPGFLIFGSVRCVSKYHIQDAEGNSYSEFQRSWDVVKEL